MKKLKSWYNNIPSTLVTGGLLIIITVIAAFLRFYQIGKLSLWTDEIITMRYINHNLKDMFQIIWPKEMNMSLYYLIASYWVQIFPNASEGTFRTISAIFSIASIPIVFFLGRTIGTDRRKATTIGLVSAFIISLNAYHIQFAQELRSYSLVFLLATFSTLLLIKAIEKPKSVMRWIGYIVVSAAALYSHIFVVFLLAAHVLSLTTLLRTDSRHFLPLKIIIGSGIAISVLAIPLLVATFSSGASGLSWIKSQSFNIKDFVIELTGSQGKLLYIAYILTSIIGFLGERAWLQKDIIKRWTFILIASCLFLPVITLFVISKTITPLFVNRYLFFVLPYLTIFSAIGIVNLINFRWKIFKLAGILALLLTIGLSVETDKHFFETFKKEDWRGVSQFMTTNCSDEKDLRLYYVTWVEGYTSYYNSALKPQNKSLEQALNNSNSNKIVELIPDGYDKLCLVLAQNWTTKDKSQTKVIQSTLKAKYPIVTKTQFYLVDVEIYKL